MVGALITIYTDYVDQDGNGVTMTSQFIKFASVKVAKDAMAAIYNTYADEKYTIHFTVFGGVV